jgi:alpha-beta hydrolase superfamily lysophospholipase
MKTQPERVTFASRGDAIVGSLFAPEGGGPCPALLICHGAGEFKEHYYELAEFLAERGVASLAIDMHGHGESAGQRFHVNIQDWVADIRAAVHFLSNDQRINHDRIGAFGLSSGGTAILEAALVESRLKALIALDATVRTSMPLVFWVCMRILLFAGTLKKQLTRLDLRVPLAKLMGSIQLAADPQIDRRLRSDPRTLEAYMAFPLPGAAESIFVDTIKRVAGIKAPTLVLWGEEDKLDPPETARILYDTLVCPKRLQIIPGNGHVGHLDRNRHQVFDLTAQWALEHLA